MPIFDKKCGISIELKSRLGWTEPDRYPGTVLVQHDCCYDYGVNYYPKLTCKRIIDEGYAHDDFECSECGYVVWGFLMEHEGEGTTSQPNYCPACGAIVVD